MSRIKETLKSRFRRALPVTRETALAIAEGNSVVLSGPRNFLSEQIVLDALKSVFGDSLTGRIVRLSAARIYPTGTLDFEVVSTETRRQLGMTGQKKCHSANDYVGQMLAYFKACKRPVTIFLLRGGDRSQALLFRELIDAIHQIVDYSDSDEILAKRMFVAIDDFSLHYLIQDSETLRSEWFRARWLQFDHLTRDELSNLCLKSFPAEFSESESARSIVVDSIIESTDGHFGLIEELLEYADTNEQGIASLITGCNNQDSRNCFSRSKVLERIRAAISDDSTGLCATALDHREPKMPSEYRSPRIQVLRQLGILKWDNAYKARMCRGVIGEMVSAIAGQDKKTRLGTVTGMAGISRFEWGEFSPGESDIVVVHISDLHFGADFGYRLNVGGKTINESQIDIASLLESDARHLNLIGKIDALVISGDVACDGTSAEYSRALEVLREIARALGVEKERIVVVPGNHDLQWNPGEFSRREGGRNVSRENFDSFAQLLCNKAPTPSDMLELVSRDGHFGLRIVSLDSNEVEGPEAGGVGFIGEDCLREAKAILLRSKIPEAVTRMNTWFVMHHHISAVTSTPIVDAKKRGVSVLANAPALLAVVRDLGVEVILHGHEHQPAVTELRWWLGERASEFGSVAAIGAGSLTAKRERLGPVSKNQYMILVRRPNELVIRSRVMGDEGLAFRSHEDLMLTFARPAAANLA